MFILTTIRNFWETTVISKAYNKYLTNSRYGRRSQNILIKIRHLIKLFSLVRKEEGKQSGILEFLLIFVFRRSLSENAQVKDFYKSCTQLLMGEKAVIF